MVDCSRLNNEPAGLGGSAFYTVMKYLLMMSRTGLEPATTALKDQNGLIAGVPFRDFSVRYGNPVSLLCSSVLPVGLRLGHNGLGSMRIASTCACWLDSLRVAEVGVRCDV